MCQCQCVDLDQYGNKNQCQCHSRSHRQLKDSDSALDTPFSWRMEHQDQHRVNEYSSDDQVSCLRRDERRTQESCSWTRSWTRSSMALFCLALGLSASVCVVNAVPIKSDSGAMMYLSQYGWLDKTSMKAGSAALLDMSSAIKDFQLFAGLNQTGQLDDETVRMMSMPRCGVRDRVGHDARRKKRFALQGSRWRVRGLTYKVTKYPRGLDRAEVDREMAEAFSVWSQATNLSFAEAPGSASKTNIEIRFERKEHGDGDAFDGEGGTLAHAYFPVYGGDAHFDDDERWSIKSYRGTNLFQVAAHEFGHSLGLSHSDVSGALMAPFYRGYQPSFKLHEDDILAIQSLYGKKQAQRQPPTTTTTRRTTTTTRRPVPSNNGPGSRITPAPPTPAKVRLCTDPKPDAITVMGDGGTYVFKGDEYYKLNDKGIDEGYPRKISPNFDGLPANLDAAFTWTNDRTYFFKGSQYWRFTNMGMDAGYPKDIIDGFEGIPSSLDAALVWGGNGKIYFFKGDKYWRFDPSRRPPVTPGYPKPISNWEGIPNNIDGALRYNNGYTYFFKENKYWRFNDRNFAVDQTDPPFPRLTENWWYGCDALGTSAMRNNNNNNNVNVGNSNSVADYMDESAETGGRTNSHNVNRNGCISHTLLTPNSSIRNLSLVIIVLSSLIVSKRLSTIT